MASPHLTPLHEAVERLSEVWAEAGNATNLSREQLLEAHQAMGVVQRRLDGMHAELAACIARESRPELGAGSLAKQQGFRNPATMIAATTGGSTGDAARLVKVGEATAPRANLIGEVLPPRFPEIQRAIGKGEISAAAAAMIVTLLDAARLKAGVARVAEAECLLVERAAGLSLDDVRKLIVRAAAWLDPDGVAPREEEARSHRSLTMFERDGSLHLTLQTDIASGAPVKAAIQAYVTAIFQARANVLDPEAPDADRRTVAMMQADALAEFCAHVVGCDNGGLPISGATVVVRVGLEELTTGNGVATVDGLDQPISISACRRMAASGGIIPVVLGGEGEILDWGRKKRLFTRAQRLALVERDGGCVMCGLAPQLTKAHHLRWWQRDSGPTDMNNGVLLCESCHHRIHDNGWEIRIDGRGFAARVWLIPPSNVDRQRRPRLGGKARYDIAA